MKKKKLKIKQKTQPQQPCSVTLILNGENFKSSGKTLEDALLKITLPQKIVTKVIMKVKNGEIEKERVLRAFQVMKLFSPNPIIREIVLKNFKILFNI